MAPDLRRLDSSVDGRFEAEWRARFGRFALRHVDEAAVSGWSEAGLRRRLQAFQTLLPVVCRTTPARVLDVGCGAGTYVRFLAGQGHFTIGVDYSFPTLARAVCLDDGATRRYLSAAAYALPLPGGAFDLVLSIGVLQALADPRRAVVEMARVLAGGGYLVIEALNAAALTARARAGVERLSGQSSRVRTYRPAAVCEWLRAAGLLVEHHVPVLLPPRALPGAEPILESVQRAARRLHWFGQLGAHSFLFAARKPVDGEGRHHRDGGGPAR